MAVKLLVSEFHTDDEILKRSSSPGNLSTEDTLTKLSEKITSVVAFESDLVAFCTALSLHFNGHFPGEPRLASVY